LTGALNFEPGSDCSLLSSKVLDIWS